MSAPYTVVEQTLIPATAADEDKSGGYIKAPFKGTVTLVQLIMQGDIIGADGDSRSYELYNRGGDGDGVKLVASKTFVDGVNADEDEDEDLLLATDPADLEVVEGDVLEFMSVHVGTAGMAGPAAQARVTFSRSSGE